MTPPLLESIDYPPNLGKKYASLSGSRFIKEFEKSKSENQFNNNKKLNIKKIKDPNNDDLIKTSNKSWLFL